MLGIGIGGLSPGARVQRPLMNLLQHNEDFSSPIWTPNQCTVVAGAGSTPPSGPTVAATQLKEDGTNNQHYVAAFVTGNWTVASLVSVYAKAATRSFLALYLSFDVTHQAWAFFNLTTGALGTNGHSAASDGAGSAIRALGSGWYHCSLIFGYAAPAGSTLEVDVQPCNVDNVYTYLGVSGNVAIEVVGAMLEPTEAYYRT